MQDLDLMDLQHSSVAFSRDDDPGLVVAFVH